MSRRPRCSFRRPPAIPARRTRDRAAEPAQRHRGRVLRRADDGDRADQALPGHPRDHLPAPGRAGPQRGRRLVRGDPWRDPGHRRRVGLRQDHDRAHADAAHRADRRADRLRRPRHHAPARRGHAPAAPRDTDDLPGPVLVAESPAHGRRHRGRAMAAAKGQDGQGHQARASRNCWNWSGSTPSTTTGTRTSSPAASGSGSGSRARSRCGPSSSWPTSRCPRWTCPSRPR